MNFYLVIFAVFSFLGFILLSIFYLKTKSALKRFSGISDLEEHQRAVQKEIDDARQVVSDLEKQVSDTTEKRNTVKTELDGLSARVQPMTEYVSLQERLELLKKDVEAVEETQEMQGFGMYRQRFGLDTSEDYKDKIDDVRRDQKDMIRDKEAAVCDIEWTVEGSKAKGRKMVRQSVQLMLRAFNGECDAAVLKVKYNNEVSLKNRIEKSFAAINKLGESNKIRITDKYLQLKLDELDLVHEFKEKKEEEREEQKRIKDAMREEQKALKEIEKAKEKAEAEEKRNQAALEKARAELADATGRQHDKLEALVAKLENELSEAIDRKAKAIARAQLTRSGHVYVISNIGSFGETIYKIGMTRRLEPLDRVKELGDASVPFKYDVHAMIYSEDAPALENSLHKHFEARRVNKVNLRREFFKVTLDEIRVAVGKFHGIITMVTVPEAEEYRKTLAMEAEGLSSTETLAS